METKECSKCGEVKEVGEFTESKKCKNGISGTCKKCTKEYNKKYRVKNCDKLLQLKRKWIDDNRNHVNESNRKYKKENSEKEHKYKTNYNNANRKQVNEKNLNRYKYSCEHLGNMYVNSLLRQSGFTTEQINENPELIEVKRLIIKTKRLCKTLPTLGKA